MGHPLGAIYQFPNAECAAADAGCDALDFPRRNPLMNSVLKFVQVFALGTWIGSIMYLSFIVAPGAFATLKDREQAGALVGYSLSRLHLVGMILGLLYLVTAFVLVRGVRDLGSPGF